MSDRETLRLDFLKAAGLADAVRAPLPGDASTRSAASTRSTGGMKMHGTLSRISRLTAVRTWSPPISCSRRSWTGPDAALAPMLICAGPGRSSLELGSAGRASG